MLFEHLSQLFEVGYMGQWHPDSNVFIEQFEINFFFQGGFRYRYKGKPS